MRTRNRRSALGCGVAGALVLLAVTAYQFIQHGAAVAQLAQKAAPIMVAITDPHTGQQAAAGAGLLVHTEAGGPNPLNSLELWVDGQVVGIQAAPAGPGLTSFSADFAWTPDAPGTYSLVARA